MLWNPRTKSWKSSFRNLKTSWIKKMSYSRTIYEASISWNLIAMQNEARLLVIGVAWTKSTTILRDRDSLLFMTKSCWTIFKTITWTKTSYWVGTMVEDSKESLLITQKPPCQSILPVATVLEWTWKVQTTSEEPRTVKTTVPN